MGGASSEPTKFPCGRWLEECEGCGGKLEVELVPEGSLGYQQRRKMEGEGYAVKLPPFFVTSGSHEPLEGIYNKKL